MKKLSYLWVSLVMAIGKYVYAVDSGFTGQGSGSSNLKNIKAVSGTATLINDATGVLIYLMPIVGGGFVAYFWFAGMANPKKKQEMHEHVKQSLIATAIGLSIVAIFNAITGYYVGN